MSSAISKFFIILGLATLSVSMYASSTGSYGGSSRGGGNYGDTNRRPIDQAYEYGKAVYQGKNGVKFKYCIANGDNKVKLKGKSARPYKRKSASQFAAALYDCNNPETQVATKISKQDLSALVYYFNKRYRLKLTGI